MSPRFRSPHGARLAAVALLCLAVLPYLRAEEPPPFDPAGIPGKLVLAGSAVPDEAIERFLDLAGGQSASVVLLLTEGEDAKLAARLLDRWTTAGAGGLSVFRIGKTGTPDRPEIVSAVRQATGVWLADGDAERVGRLLTTSAVGQEARLLLRRNGVLGFAGSALPAVALAPTADNDQDSPPIAPLLPDAVVLSGDGKAAVPTPKPGQVGYRIDPDAVLVVRGRMLHQGGPGKVTIALAGGKFRPARQIVLEGRDRFADLTELRNAARDRADATFPPADPGTPEVPNGTLIIIGGGGMPAGMVNRFVELAGGKKAAIVVLPTAMPDPLPDRDGMAEALRRAGAGKVTVLKSRTRAEVESPEFLRNLREATAIWFGGGRQWRFVDAYAGTKAEAEMHALLKRGGVIAGSSAGATIQGDYLCRGGAIGNLEIMAEGYERGLQFLPGVGIDQHFTQRKRLPDMTAFMKVFPQYLGIGIDEATAIVVRGHEAEVAGRGRVHFYDSRRPHKEGEPDYDAVGDGGRYDLKERKVLSPGKAAAPPARKAG